MDGCEDLICSGSGQAFLIISPSYRLLQSNPLGLDVLFKQSSDLLSLSSFSRLGISGDLLDSFFIWSLQLWSGTDFFVETVRKHKPGQEQEHDKDKNKTRYIASQEKIQDNN